MIKTSITCSKCNSKINFYRHNLLNFVICPNCNYLLKTEFISNKPIDKINYFGIKIGEEVLINNRKYLLTGAIKTNNFEIFMLVLFSELITAIKYNNDIFVGKAEKLYYSIELDDVKEKQIINISIDKYLVKQKFEENFVSGSGQLFYNPLKEKLKLIRVSNINEDLYLLITEETQFLLRKINLPIEDINRILRLSRVEKDIEVKSVETSQKEPNKVLESPSHLKEESFELKSVIETTPSLHEEIIEAKYASNNLFDGRRINCGNCGIVMSIDNKIPFEGKNVKCPKCGNIQRIGKKIIKCPKCKTENTLQMGEEINTFSCGNCNTIIEIENGKVKNTYTLSLKLSNNQKKFIDKITKFFPIGKEIRIKNFRGRYKIIGLSIFQLSKSELIARIFLHREKYGIFILEFIRSPHLCKWSFGIKVNIKHKPKKSIIRFEKKRFWELGKCSYKLLHFEGEAIQYFTGTTILVYANSQNTLVWDENISIYSFNKGIPEVKGILFFTYSPAFVIYTLFLTHLQIGVATILVIILSIIFNIKIAIIIAIIFTYIISFIFSLIDIDTFIIDSCLISLEASINKYEKNKQLKK